MTEVLNIKGWIVKYYRSKGSWKAEKNGKVSWGKTPYQAVWNGERDHR